MAQAIVSKFFGPTNTRGARIQVTSWQGKTTFAYDYGLEASDNHLAAIKEHIAKISKDATNRIDSPIEYKIIGESENYWEFMGAVPAGNGYIVVVI